MKNFKKIICLLLAFCTLFACACAKEEPAVNDVSVLIVPHFEIGEMTDEAIGEAQLFYQEYLNGCEEYTTKEGSKLYFNPENKVAMCIPGYGKVNTAIALTSVFSDNRFDFSDSYVVSPGCAGGAVGTTVFGDVVIESAVCDFDLGHTIDSSELADKTGSTWFHDVSFDTMDCKVFNEELINEAFEVSKNVSLETTDIAVNTLQRNFAKEEWINRKPQVFIGTAVTADNYWKGKLEHQRALDITSYYQCKDPYAITEMEDVSTAAVCERFGLLDRLIVLRGSVNVDVFLDNATPEELWDENFVFADDVTSTNEETLDIFGPTMYNIFNVGKEIIDNLLLK